MISIASPRGFLLRQLVIRDWRARYAGSAMGFLWAYAQPAVQLVLFTFVFSTVLRIPGGTGGGTGGFALFLFAGLLPWLGFSEGLQRATFSFEEGGFMVRKHAFPAQLLVGSAVISAFLQQLAATVVFALVVLATVGSVAWSRVLLWPPLVLAQLALTFALGLALAVGQVLLRDIGQGLGLGLMFWFYVTPIVYPASLAPAWFARLAEANPMATLVAGHRWMFLAGEAPSATALGLLGFWLVAALIVAGWLFHRIRPTLADEL